MCCLYFKALLPGVPVSLPDDNNKGDNSASGKGTV